MSRARTFADLATASEEGSLANRNYFYNGDMQIYQRGSTAVASDSIARTLDRWRMYNYSDGAVTVTQDTNAPSATAFTKSLKIDVTTADSSIGADEVAFIQQRFEGQDLQNFLKGTSSAKKATLQFWVSSPKTGTHIVEWYDTDNTRQISKTYTISSANTWEFKTITFDADTTGTWNNDNLQSLEITWWLCAGTNFTSGTLNTTWGSVTAANRAVGQVNVFDNTSNNFYMTGCQMEIGEFSSTTIPPFQFEDFGDNLARCQRYFQMIAEGDNKSIGVGGYYTGANVGVVLDLKEEMRTTPSITQSSGANYFDIQANDSTDTFNTFTITDSTERVVRMYNNTEVSGTAGHFGMFRTSDSSAKIGLDAEL